MKYFKKIKSIYIEISYLVSLLDTSITKTVMHAKFIRNK
jgi:hypothetical protein